MSDRLDFLAKTRPEAAGAYLKFLKESGRHLDDKTRFLISVVTKVVSGTASGLRQYVPHAIRAGASGQEVLDAVLMSFPAAGLTKVLDAIGVLQGMDLPELRIEVLAREEEWHKVLRLKELPKKELVYKKYGGRDLIFYNVDGEDIKVYDRVCPHLGNRLPKVSGGGDIIECKVHNWCFDINLGDCVSGGDRGLREYESRLTEGGDLEVKMIRLDSDNDGQD